MGCLASKLTEENTTEGIRVPVQMVQVIRVVDGDTVIVGFESRERDRVRLARINAAESGTADYERDRGWLVDLVDGERVKLVSKYPRPRDGFGRIIGEIYLGNLCVSDELLRRGVPVYRRRK
jgi:endonuclease YncB( thermonuclease family)